MPDVAVVGAGHNALVAACYLARAGLDVEVIERDTVPGGAVSTVERFPGHRVDRGSSAHIMIRHTGIIEELRLIEAGLRYDDLDPWAFAPFWTDDGEQVALTFWVDVDRTCESIARVCGERDAVAYQRFVEEWGQRTERVFAAFTDRPTPGRLVRTIWGAGRGTGGLELARQFLGSADAVLDAYFADERLKTALAWLGAQSGPPPHETATAALAGWPTMLHRIPPGHPHGGSGMLAEALARRLASYGGRLRVGDGASAIAVRNGAVAGVRTGSGEMVAARAVVAGCHVATTLALLGDALPPALSRRRKEIRVGNGIGMAVRLATTCLPRYPAAGGDPAPYRGLQLLAPSRHALRAAYGDFLAGREPERPAALAMTFSAFDDSLAPPGRHGVSVWGQWYPYARAAAADRLVAEVERAAPGFAATIERVHAQTPADIERELGMPRGNVMHVEMTLESMFTGRPLPELAGYRVPGVAGLYLTGASMHPGGGVSGASGRIAARIVLADRSGRRRARRAFSGS